MKTLLITTTFLFVLLNGFAQDYTSYFTGNTQDIQTSALGGICLMGGATEHDEAMKWFLQRANGGDILVLRASGSDGYNDYLYSELGVTVNSVETIVFNNSMANNDPYIISKVAQAEAIWFAGGDQWNYVSYWRNTPIDSTINQGLELRNIAIGGTSAGMAIQGQYYFSAENGSVTSAVALNNPYENNVTVDHAPFLYNDALSDVITDTHFDNPDRSGRLITFMARMRTDDGIVPKAIACNEYVAVCIDPITETASVYGDYPNYDEFAFFLQLNCEEPNNNPETCVAGSPLNWSVDNNAVKVYKVPGTMNGTNTFSLADWSTGLGGFWESWSVSNGVLNKTSTSALDCSLGIQPEKAADFELFPIPASSEITIVSDKEFDHLEIMTPEGKNIQTQEIASTSVYSLDISGLPAGVYYLKIRSSAVVFGQRFVKQ